MSDLISREALVRKMNERYCKIDNGRAFKGIEIPVVDGVRMHEIECCIGMIQSEDVIEAEPVRHGEWKWVFNRKADTWGDDCYESGWECSECGAGADIYTSYHKVEESCEESEKGITDERTIYCHNCGAKMDGGAEE